MPRKDSAIGSRVEKFAGVDVVVKTYNVVCRGKVVGQFDCPSPTTKEQLLALLETNPRETIKSYIHGYNLRRRGPIRSRADRSPELLAKDIRGAVLEYVLEMSDDDSTLKAYIPTLVAARKARDNATLDRIAGEIGPDEILSWLAEG